MKLVISSRNQKKIKELKKIFADCIPYNMPELLSLDDIGFEGDIEENGRTFEENAMIKAEAVHRFCSLPVFADDSGICVNALGGEPGIYSARYAGEEKNDRANIDKLLKNLENKSDKSGYFVCVVAYIDAKGEKHIFRGECHGEIINQLRGENGFGYDPIFYVEEYKKTFAEIGEDIKNKISHRAAAMEKFTNHIKKEVENADK